MKPIDYAHDWVHGLTPYSPGKTVEGAVKLASNENDWGPSPKVISGLRRKVKEVFRYPHRDNDVKEALAGYCGAKAENIVLGNGSDELIELIVKAFRGPIASHYPTFLEYPTYAAIYNVPYMGSKLGPGFAFEAERFISETSAANLIFLCTPNNPTGTVIEPADVEKVAKAGKIVVVDEAYAEFWGKTLVPLAKDYPNIIVLKTMAKAFGLAGLRMGYAVASQEIAQALSKVKSPFNVNSLAHEAALLALADVPYMRRTVGKIVRDRGRLERALAKKYRVIPSKTNFILADVSPMKPGEFYDRMLKRGFVVRPQPAFDGFPGSWVRITVGTTGENTGLIRAIGSL